MFVGVCSMCGYAECREMQCLKYSVIFSGQE